MALPDKKRQRVRARSWWVALEAVLGAGTLPADGEDWRISQVDGRLDVHAGDTLLASLTRVHESRPPRVRAFEDAGSRAEASRAALSHALEKIPAESGAVLLSDSGYLRFVAASGPRATSVIGVRLSASTGVAGYTMQTQRGVLVGEAGSDPRHYDGFDDLTGYRTGQLLAVPVSYGGDAHGVLELMNPPVDRPFRSSDLALLERVGRKLGRILAGMGSPV